MIAGFDLRAASLQRTEQRIVLLGFTTGPNGHHLSPEIVANNVAAEQAIKAAILAAGGDTHAV